MDGLSDCESYRQRAENVAATLQKYYKDTSGWKESKKSKHFVISYRSSSEFEGYLYKGEAIINAKPKTVFDYVEPLPDGKRAQWDKNMKTIEVIKKLDHDLRINRVSTASACGGMISPRDFVDLIIIKNTDECLSTNAVSIPYDACPVDSGHVRGHNYNCGMIVYKYPKVWLAEVSSISVAGALEEQKKFVRGWNYECGILVFPIPNEPEKCKLVSLVQPDIKGMLPKSLVSKAIPGSMAEFFTALRAALKEDGQLVDDEENDNDEKI